MHAFWELSSCRDFGGGATGPIPWTVIMQFADRQGLDKEATDIFLEIIRSLDSAWLEYQNKRES